MVIEPRSSSTPQPVDTPAHAAGSPGDTAQEDRRAMEQHYRSNHASPHRHGSEGDLSPRSSPTGTRRIAIFLHYRHVLLFSVSPCDQKMLWPKYSGTKALYVAICMVFLAFFFFKTERN